MSGGLRLNWALLAAFDPDRVARVPPDLARVFQVAGESLNLVARPIERFYGEPQRRAGWRRDG